MTLDMDGGRAAATRRAALAIALASGLALAAAASAGPPATDGIADAPRPDATYHEGPTDKYGCHKDSEGRYHCHP